MELVLPRVKATENNQDQPFEAVGQEDHREDQNVVAPVRLAERSKDIVKGSPKGKKQGNAGRDQDENNVDYVFPKAFFLLIATGF